MSRDASTTVTAETSASLRARLLIPHPRPFRVDLTVAAHHLGAVVKHVSNVEYVRWLDLAAERHADALGYTRARMLDEGRMWFVSRHEVDYLAETWLDDELHIYTWVADVARVRSWREYVIHRPGDDVIISRARTLWVLVNLSTRRPLRIPPDMAERFDPLVSAAQGNPGVPGIPGAP